MSKKNKAKFKKHLKVQMLQEISREVNAPEAVQTSAPINTQTSVPTLSNTATATVNNSDSMIVNLAQIKYDLKKTAIIVLILAITIGVLSFLDQKYDILISFGNWLFKVLNIQ